MSAITISAIVATSSNGGIDVFHEKFDRLPLDTRLKQKLAIMEAFLRFEGDGYMLPFQARVDCVSNHNKLIESLVSRIKKYRNRGIKVEGVPALPPTLARKLP